MGNLVVTQNTSLSWPNSYITKRSLRLSFLLHDPSDFFKSASFFYRWDFGDGYAFIFSPSLPPSLSSFLPRFSSPSTPCTVSVGNLSCPKNSLNRSRASGGLEGWGTRTSYLLFTKRKKKKKLLSLSVCEGQRTISLEPWGINQTQVTGLGTKYLYSLSHLINLKFVVLIVLPLLGFLFLFFFFSTQGYSL